ncbi:MAG: methylcobamide--CoM methyltransferase [Anaerolineaceae bacterium]|nr:methylcobamide--CoM methyltransferase [Anaerolineaceae bacterium]
MTTNMLRNPYTKETVRAVVERRGGEGIPIAFHKWWGEGTYEKYSSRLDEISADIPDDAPAVSYITPGEYQSPTADPNYRWAFSGSPHPEGGSLDARVLLPDWRDLDAYLAEFPDLDRQPGIFDATRAFVQAHPDRYILGHWWYMYYERLWSIRGMQNVLMDFIEHPDELKRLGRALLDHHVKAVRGLAACGVDGIFTSDDLGSQRALMMSPAVFRKVLKPLYAELIAETHALGMHFWLHTCGNVLSIMDDFIDIGLDVIHPIQAHTMNYAEVAERFGGKISFLVGIDVQHLLPEGSPEEVRRGIREVIQTFRRPEGGLMLAAGNGIMPETPLENIRAFLEESARG